MSQVTIGVLALQGDVREQLAMFTGLSVPAVPIRRPAELDHVDALVIPGGESTTISRLVDSFELRHPIEQRLKEGMPAYGACAGLIMLAKTVLDGHPDQRSFGAIDMVVRRNAFGRQVDSFEADIQMVAGFSAEPLRAIFIRAPWVESLGAGVTVLASVSGPQNTDRIVAVREGNALATSFHPELTGNNRVHSLFVQIVRNACGG